MAEVRILDSRGNPIADNSPLRRPRANTGGPSYGQMNTGIFPYEAASIQTAEMGNWLPYIRSPDAEINLYRDRVVARSRDLVRNDGWASGGVTRILDNTVGSALRLSANPDYRALRAISGIKGFDAVWADEFRRAAEALWRTYSEDLRHFNDVERKLTVGQQFRIALRHKLIDGDSLMVAYWLPERVGYGAARYATAFQLVDPDRLSNPYQGVDSKYMRGGAEIDDHGVPVAYHIRKAHQNDWYNAIESMEWERIEQEDPDGWQRVIHDCDRERAGQNRGVGVFAPVLGHLKMLARYYGVELQAASIQAIFGTYVTSPYDASLVQEALDGDSDQLNYYQGMRADWAQERPAMLNGARVPTLAPGEDIKSVTANHPHGNFAEFTHAMLRSFAATSGISAEQVTQDWSRTNYSAARGALLESWKTLVRRSQDFKTGTATPVYGSWLREAMENGELPLPAGAPEYIEAATAYSRCNWLGVGRGWIDPVKEKQGSVLGIQAGLSTLKQECAENSGSDWEENLDQRAIEVKAFKERGLELPDWGGDSGGGLMKPDNHDKDDFDYRSK